jgi:chemotaxis protein methyltransferase CheR
MAVDLLTTNETYFFREEAHFDFLAKTIVANHPPATPFNVWSAASSTGEEIYTISFVLADTLGIDAQWSVTGSDISTAVLATAQRGLYWLDRTRGLPQSYLRKYCLKGVRSQEGGFMIAPEIKRHTRFQQVNLNRTLPALGKFHVIFLRNVMIYFDAETKRQVVARLVEQLHPGGYFIVGHSESLNGLTESLRAVKPTIYQLPT